MQVSRLERNLELSTASADRAPRLQEELAKAERQVPETVYNSLSYPALSFDWLITLTLTLTLFDNIILDKSAGSNSGEYVDPKR